MEYGSEFLLVGSHPNLGGWELDRAVPMSWTNGDVWQARLPSPGPLPHSCGRPTAAEGLLALSLRGASLLALALRGPRPLALSLLAEPAGACAHCQASVALPRHERIEYKVVQRDEDGTLTWGEARATPPAPLPHEPRQPRRFLSRATPVQSPPPRAAYLPWPRGRPPPANHIPPAATFVCTVRRHIIHSSPSAASRRLGPWSALAQPQAEALRCAQGPNCVLEPSESLTGAGAIEGQAPPLPVTRHVHQQVGSWRARTRPHPLRSPRTWR